MTYRRLAWREIGWGGAAVLAGIGLAGCDSGGGGGGCPELEGTWQVQSDCASGPSSCEVDQNSSCEIELICNNGKTYEGKATKSSIKFEDDSVECSGSLDDLEDDDENGVISPSIDADCTIADGGGMCSVQAVCVTGDCTVPEDEDNGNDEGDGGGAGTTGGISGGFSGVGGASGGAGGQGGVSGAGEGGFGGSAGIPPAGSGGFSGEGGAGSGAVGGSVSNDCGSCVESACALEASSCTAANGCDQAATCLFGSGCYFDDTPCLEAACASVPEPTGDGLGAFEDIVTCTAANCQGYCPIFSEEPGAGTGGAGGFGGIGGSEPLPCDTCFWANDEVCDGPPDCEEGTDCSDCGTASAP